jgi:hypothetical protein
MPIPGICSNVKINTADGPVKVEAVAVIDGQKVTISNRLKQGQGLVIGYPVNGIFVTNLHSAEQTVDLEASFGKITDNTVAGTVTIGGSLPALGGDSYDAEYFAYNAANGTMILDPAVNTNGVEIIDASISLQSSATNGSSVLAKGSAPSSFTDSGAILIVGVIESGRDDRLSRKLTLPAGVGIYSMTGDKTGMVNVKYNLL